MIGRLVAPLAIATMAVALTLSGPLPALASTGFEICAIAPKCKAGEPGALGGEFRSPTDVAVDGAGDVFVVDALNSRVDKFDLDGNWERAWGRDVVEGGGTGFEVCTVAETRKPGVHGRLGGELANPIGVAVDGAGSVYVTEALPPRVQKFDSDGNWERAWGKAVVEGGGTGFGVCTVASQCADAQSGGLGGELDGPHGVAVDFAGNVYVADRGNERIQRFDQFGNWQRAWGKDVIQGGGTGFEVCTVASQCKAAATGGLGGELNGPRGIAADLSAVYVADYENTRIQRFSFAGDWQRAWGKDVLQGGGTGFEICTVAATCKRGGVGGLGGELVGTSGVAAAAPNHVYVAEDLGHRIQLFATSGAWQRAWGKDVVQGGGTGFEICTIADQCKIAARGALGAELSEPVAIAVNAQRDVFVADNANHRVQRFNGNTGEWDRAWGKDVVAPDLTLAIAAKRVQRARRLAVRARCSNPCDVRLRARGRAAGTAFRSRPRAARLAAGEVRRLRLRIRGRAVRRLAEGKGRARIRAVATDAAGDRAVRRVVVRLRP